MVMLWNPTGMCRGSCVPARGEVRVLSRPVHRHNVRDSHSAPEPVLLFQPHHPVRRRLSARSRHLHSSAGRGREDRTRLVVS